MTDNKTRVDIYDTTLRDGTQAQGVSLSVQDKLTIAGALDELGVDYIEGGYPLSNPKDAAFFQEVRKKSFSHAKLAAFGMTRRKNITAAEDTGMKALLASEAPVVTIVGKTWDLHVREVLRVSDEENLQMIADSVRLMVEHDRECIYDAEHFFDGYAANSEYAMKTLAAAVEAGANCLSLCETNGGALPEQIAAAVDAVGSRFPDVAIGIHCHNDGDLAVANSLSAVRHGATHVQGTINGIGERCGNADLCSVIANLAVKYDYDVLLPGTLTKLAETSRYVYEVANLNFRDNQPFVGASAFAHKGGMHVHAVQRNVSTYEHMDPERVGNSRRILVSELSGVSNIAAATPRKFNLAEDKEAQRTILETLMELESQGYQFEAAEASYEMLIRRTLGGNWYRRLWDLDHYRCIILRRDDDEVGTEATVRLVIDGQVRHTVAEGNGPFDSLHESLSAALREKYPCMDELHLMDYKVRVVNTAAETAAKVRVVVDWHDEGQETYFGSVGVSENIIDASWQALVDAVEYKILNAD
ncbi:MAG: citramalate synthase [Phycisphaerae bacterium]